MKKEDQNTKSIVKFHKVTKSDSAGIRAILGYYIEKTPASWRYHVMEKSVIDGWIKNHDKPDRPFWVAEIDRKVVGYSCLSDFRNGEGYWPCAENSVYVHPEYNGQGIGTKLMELIIEDGRAAGLQSIIAAIDAENTGSIEFHKRFGFYQCGYLKNIGWKNNSWRSLVLMQCDLQTIVLPQKP